MESIRFHNSKLVGNKQFNGELFESSSPCVQIYYHFHIINLLNLLLRIIIT